MHNMISALRPNEASSLAENFRTLLEAPPQRHDEKAVTPAVLADVRPGPKPLDDAGAAASIAQVQTQASQGADMLGAHSVLDPQRVARLLGLLE